MKINTSKNEVCFDSLEVGDVFYFAKDYYLKTDEIDGVNAVCLSDGSFADFEYGDFIYECPNATLEVS